MKLSDRSFFIESSQYHVGSSDKYFRYDLDRTECVFPSYHGGVVLEASNLLLASLFFSYHIWEQRYYCLLVSDNGVYFGEQYTKIFDQKESVIIDKTRVIQDFDFISDQSKLDGYFMESIETNQSLHPSVWFDAYNSAGYKDIDLNTVRFIILLPVWGQTKSGGICIPSHSSDSKEGVSCLALFSFLNSAETHFECKYLLNSNRSRRNWYVMT